MLLLKPDRPRGIDRHIDYFGSASSRDRFRDWAGTLLGERRSFVLRGRSARGVDTHQHVAENGADASAGEPRSASSRTRPPNRTPP